MFKDFNSLVFIPMVFIKGSQIRISNQKPPSPTDSDSGISSLGSLEINVDEQIIDEPKKSPILSQPKTIR